MYVADWALAMWLLTGPSLEQTVDEEMFPALRGPLTVFALQLEILDPRETRYVLARQGDFKSDLQMLRRRYEELGNAPMVKDSGPFPNRTAVNELLVFNRAIRIYFDAFHKSGLMNEMECKEAQKETDKLYKVWDCVRDSSTQYYYVTVRRQALLTLRKMLGENAYREAQLPPYFPFWRMEMFSRLAWATK